MNISYSELILLDNSVIENVDRLLVAGTDRIELMMDGASWDGQNGDFASLTRELRARQAAYTVHPAAWDINLTAQTRILRDAAYDHHIQAIRFAADIGASQVVLHPGFLGSPCFNRETAQRRAEDATRRLASEAAALGVKLAMENVGYHGQSIYTEDEYATALDDVDPSVGYLIDIGHAHLNGWAVPRLIKRIAPRLLGLHIHDNDGNSDQHRPIFSGTVSWKPVFQAMKESCGPDCEYILEYAPGNSLDTLAAGSDILLAALA